MSIAIVLLGLSLVFCGVSCGISRANWPSDSVKFGQVSGVAFDKNGNAVVFHRGSRRWMANDYNRNNVYTKVQNGKVKENTLVVVNPDGQVVDSWGADLFYMPHGLTIDSENNVWVTDVAAHQVFKFTPDNKKQPALVLGEALKPGSDATHFCKPTDVAVASNGDFFVADGYCNARILKFDRNGKLLAEIVSDDELEDSLNVPHSLALIEEANAICVADRENERIICFDAGLRNSSSTGEVKVLLQDGILGPVYAIAYDKQDELLQGVGYNSEGNAIGFSIDLSGDVPLLGEWTPRRGFAMPHDIAVSADGQRMLVGDAKNDRVSMFIKKVSN